MKTRSLIVIGFCFSFVLASSAFAQNYVVRSGELKVGSDPTFYGLSDNQKRDEQTEVKTNAKIVTKFKQKKRIGYEVSDGQVSVRNGNIVLIGKGTVFKKGSVLPNGKSVGDDEMIFDGKAYVMADEQSRTSASLSSSSEAPADVVAAPADSEKTASGLASKVIHKGTGTAHPAAKDTVKVQYTGWMTDGKMFDSSAAEFQLDKVIKGWTEGLQLMVEGEKRRFWIPANLAYGDTPRRPGGPSGTLVFDVELLSYTKAPPAPVVPTDVKEVPKDAKRTESGLAYRVLTKGKGKAHPNASNVVKVHYTGWTTDGNRFDSSVMRGQPAEFPLGGVIKGWTEGVQLMVEGEKTRFWIPGKMAYGDEPGPPGRPFGMLVFDIELIEIKK